MAKRDCSVVDIDADWCDNADTEQRADTPSSVSPTAGARGVSRQIRLTEGVINDLVDLLDDPTDQRDLLRAVLRHLVDGGIIIRHGEDLVLTWADGGISTRVTRSGDP